MIGTVLIAVVGYGLALTFFGAFARVVVLDVLGRRKATLRESADALCNGIAALLFAVFTRWLLGGAL